MQTVSGTYIASWEGGEHCILPYVAASFPISESADNLDAGSDVVTACERTLPCRTEVVLRRITVGEPTKEPIERATTRLRVFATRSK
jgi:hypothetical protein